VTYTKAEKRLLSMLINFLENDLDNFDVKKLLEKSKEYKPGISNITIEECKTEKYEFYDGYSYTLPCEKPRLIICEDISGIKLIKIPSKALKKHKGVFRFILR